VFSNGAKAVAFALFVEIPNGNSILMEDRNNEYSRADDLATSVSYVDNHPELRFFINGEDIAKIEITTVNEYIYIHDFSKKLDEKYWNHELYYEIIEIGEETYQYIPPEKQLHKTHVLIFPENFTKYDQVWYTWQGWDLRKWASEDDFSRIQGYNGMSIKEVEELMENMTDEEKLAVAAGGGGTSTAGHILLDDYPEELLIDYITIVITDRQGNKATQTLVVNISNNTLGQTVVTAHMQ
jgi:hypothetical protein